MCHKDMGYTCDCKDGKMVRDKYVIVTQNSCVTKDMGYTCDCKDGE